MHNHSLGSLSYLTSSRASRIFHRSSDSSLQKNCKDFEDLAVLNGADLSARKARPTALWTLA